MPDDSITRAEFASLLVRAMRLSMEHDAAYSGFADVAGTAWYAPAVEIAVKAGLVNGVTADRFEPTARITREQMAVMIARSVALVSGKLNLPANSQSLAAFADSESISSWAQSAVTGSVEAGIIAGMDGGRFEPQQFATRAQAATMLKRLLDRPLGDSFAGTSPYKMNNVPRFNPTGESINDHYRIEYNIAHIDLDGSYGLL